MSQTQVERLFIADKTSTTGNMWRVTSSATLAAGSSDLTSNWETIDSYSAGVAGSSMSQSSGIFTFPSTGIYYVKGQMMVSRTSDAIDYTGMRIYGTSDNSSYNLMSTGYTWFENTASIYGMAASETIFDCTNTTTHKVKFNVNREQEVEVHGSNSQNITYALFIKLGDT